MRVVLDTNTILSAILSPSGVGAQILAFYRQEAFDLLLSQEILDEYLDVLTRPELQARHKRSDQQIATFLGRLTRIAVLVSPASRIEIVRDKDDDKFVECAKSGHASYIVTRDKDLLDLGEYEGIRIIEPWVFLQLLQQRMV